MYPVKMTLAANETREIAAAGTYFELRSAPGGVLAEVLLNDRTGAQFGRMLSVLETDTMSLSRSFETIIVTNGPAAQTITFYHGDGRSGSNRFSGNVVVANVSGAFTQAAVAVGVASGALAAANAARRYLHIQNKDAAGTIYVTLDGTAATVAKGLRLGPGDALELTGFVPTGAVNVIGDAANANVIVVEG